MVPMLREDNVRRGFFERVEFDKVAAKDVVNALKRREQMIRDLRSKLASLQFGADPGNREAPSEPSS